MSDPDKLPDETFLIYFDGIFEPYEASTSSNEDGDFSLTDEFPDLVSGFATAQAVDLFDATSEEVVILVLIS